MGRPFPQAPGELGSIKPRCNTDMKLCWGRNNIVRSSLARYAARKLLVLFDVVITILLIVLLGDGEDDLRLHPDFLQSLEAWWR